MISKETYPILSTLYESGIYGLFKLAESDFGFTPSGSYLSKCDLCLDIRRFLVLEKRMESRELQPGQFYEDLR